MKEYKSRILSNYAVNVIMNQSLIIVIPVNFKQNIVSVYNAKIVNKKFKNYMIAGVVVTNVGNIQLKDVIIVIEYLINNCKVIVLLFIFFYDFDLMILFI